MDDRTKQRLLEDFLEANPMLKKENQSIYEHKMEMAKARRRGISDSEILTKAKNLRFPKKSYTLTKEQIAQNERYMNLVKYPPKEELITLDIAKKAIWQIIKEDDLKKGRTFLLDNYNTKALNSLCCYFLGIQSDLDLRKGIWIYGKLGSGKTYMANLFSRWTRRNKMNRNFWMHSMEGLRKKIKSDKSIECLNKFQTGTHGFDDVGQEKEINVYGDKENIFQNILEAQYREWEDDSQIMVVTSNLLPKRVAEALNKSGSEAIYDIDSKYDERTADRINQMFNFIPLMGQNKRRL